MLRLFLLARPVLLLGSLFCRPTWSDSAITTPHRLHASSKIINPRPSSPCLNDTDKLFDLQNTSTLRLYKNLCGIRFTQVAIINKTMLIFSSIVNSPDNSTFDFEALKQISVQNPNFDYHLVLRFQLTALPDYLIQVNVSVDSLNYPVNLTHSNGNKVVEFLVPKVFSVLNPTRPRIQLANDTWNNVLNESYLMVCVNRFNQMLSHCEPYVHNTKVECFCWHKDDNGFIIVGFVLGLKTFIIIVLLLLVYTGKRQFRSSMPEVQYSFILCMPGFGKFDYLVIFRVGPITDGFDFDKAYIDFQLFGPQSEPIGIPTRFSCKNLSNRFRGEMHLVVSRITPMPHLTHIEANHSSEYGLIFFNDFSVINIKTEEEVQTGVIKQYIKLEPKRFSPDREESESIREEVQWLAQAHRFILDPKERLAIGALVAAFVALATIVPFRFFRLWYYWNDLSASLPPVLICVGVVVSLSWLLIVLIEHPFKHIIKHNYFKELFLQVSSENGINTPLKIINWVLLCFYTIALVLVVLAFCLSFSLSLVHGALWSGINIITLVLVIGTWLLKDSICIVKPQSSRRMPQEEKSASQSQGPIFIPVVKSGAKCNGLASIEPQLVNPNLERSDSSNVSKKSERVLTSNQKQASNVHCEVSEACGSSVRCFRKCSTASRGKFKKRSKSQIPIQASNRE